MLLRNYQYILGSKIISLIVGGVLILLSLPSVSPTSTGIQTHILVIDNLEQAAEATHTISTHPDAARGLITCSDIAHCRYHTPPTQEHVQLLTTLDRLTIHDLAGSFTLEELTKDTPNLFLLTKQHTGLFTLSKHGSTSTTSTIQLIASMLIARGIW